MLDGLIKRTKNDDFNLIIIYEAPRIGKSTYALKGMGQVILYLWGEDIYDPRICKRYLGWDPTEKIETWLNIIDRIPCFTWDDAGYWLRVRDWII